MTERDDIARAIVQAIIDDLIDRRGLNHAWWSIDDDIRDEIKATWTEKARAVLDAGDSHD